MQIIVAADSPLNQRIIENTTRKAGFTQISSYTSAQQIFDALDDDPADLIITEKQLPDIDAIQLTTHVQQKTSQTSVVIIADEFTSDEALAAIRAGAKSLLIKPVLPDQLRQKIQGIS